MNDHLPLGDLTPSDVKACSDAAFAGMVSGPGAKHDPEPGDIASAACAHSHANPKCPERTIEPGDRAHCRPDERPGDRSGYKSRDLCGHTVSDVGSKPDRNPATALFRSITRHEVYGTPRVGGARGHMSDCYRRGYPWRKPLGRPGAIAEPSV